MKCCSGRRRLQRQLLSRFQRRQLVLQFLVFFILIIFRFFVDLEESVELHHRSGNAEPEHIAARLGVDIHRSLVEHRGIHLRSDEALPDQLVNLEFIFLEILFDQVGMAHRRSWDESLRAPPALLSSPYMYSENRANMEPHTRW